MKSQQTLIYQILRYAKHFPNKAAIIFDDKTITYSTLGKNIINAANFLWDLGIRKGDKIILSASHSPLFIFGYLATHLAGAIAVPIDPKLPKKKVLYIIKKTAPKEIFLNDQIDRLISMQPRTIRKIVYPRSNQIADILFTSGTLGEPKGVILTHKNIYSAAKNINLFIGNNSKDSEVIPLPLSHSFGLGRLRCNLLAGSTIILCNGFLNPVKILELIKKHRATGLSSVPAGFAILLKLAKDKIAQLKDILKYIEIGSAPMSIEDKKALMHLLPKTRICMHFGLTEASRSLFTEFHTDSKKLDSIGKPSPNVEIKIVNKSTIELPKGSVGLLMIKADTVMQGYLNNKKSTNKVLKGGWFLTEDLGYVDSEGYYYLSGRESDVINIGGEKVFPQEIESVLNKHKDISESACVGIGDPGGISGQIVKAYIVPKNIKPAVDQLIRFLRLHIEEYKIPKVFEWVKKIPKTQSGKIQRWLLK